MKVIIKHRSRGRIRVQMAQPQMSLEQADLLECYLQRLPQVIRASVHERTRCAIVEYQGSQTEILLAFSRFSYEMENLHPPVSSSRALNRTYEEKLVGMAAAKAVSVLFFPAPLRIAYTVWKAIPHLFRGLRCLLRGQMVVEVLDALSIGISLLRGDFSTASSVRFLLGLGELLEEWTHKKSVSDLAQCMSLNIDRVWLKTPQGEILTPLSQIQTGDQVCVRLGGLIPLDGVIIFAAVMFCIYAIAMGGWAISIGTIGTDWANDVLFGEMVPGLFDTILGALGVAEGGWLYGLIQDGIVAGVGAVLGFVPQMLVLFLLLAILEDVGYMARVAFIMDRIFRRFGLSGKSFIPMLVATGCGVPGIMASRTIEQDRDRKMTIMTTGFIPCGAKMPIIGLFAGAVFGGAAWVATSAFFIGIAAVVISGIMLKKFKAFAGEPAPFVMELPAYHAPSASNVLRATWERGWSFIKRAGTIILLSSIVLWFLQGYGFENGVFQAVEDNNSSLLASIGSGVAIIFAPLGWVGDMAWKATVATVTGLIAKEEVVNTFGVLYQYAGEADLMEDASGIYAAVGADFGAMAAYSFMIFNLLCAPCFAAMGTIKREMNNAKWTLGAIGYMCGFAYVVSLIVFQLGGLVTGEAVFGLGTVVALVLLAGILFLLFRKGYQGEESTRRLTSVAAAQ